MSDNIKEKRENTDPVVVERDHFNELLVAIKDRIENIYANAPMGVAPLFYQVDKYTRKLIAKSYRNFIEYGEYVLHTDCSSCLRFIREYGDILRLDTDDNLHWVIWPHPDDLPAGNHHIQFLKMMHTWVRDGSVQIKRPLSQGSKPIYSNIWGDARIIFGDIASFSSKHECKFNHLHVLLKPDSVTDRSRMGSFVKMRDDYHRDLQEGLLDKLLLVRVHDIVQDKDINLRYRVVLSLRHLVDLLAIDKKLHMARIIRSKGFYPRLKNTPLGELISDIKHSDDVDAAVARYNKMTDPHVYMKPTRDFTMRYVKWGDDMHAKPSVITMEDIKELALANGFKLKEQPNGTMDLNPYVYDFAKALLSKVELSNSGHKTTTVSW